MSEATETASASTEASIPNTVTLDTPIKRGETEITTVTLRKPNAGELRGLSLQALHTASTDELLRLLPRITAPALNPHECAQLDPADLSEMGGIVIGFLLKKSVVAAALASQTA